jgi:hypothetical protein
MGWTDVRKAAMVAATEPDTMQYIAYMREQAESFRKMAANAPDPERARELRELAETCEEIAEEWEARLNAG